MNIADNQVFLILGSHGVDGVIAAVRAADVDTARTGFINVFPGATPISWPSLEDLANSVAILRKVQAGIAVQEIPVIDTFQDPAPYSPMIDEEEVCPDSVLAALGQLRQIVLERDLPDPFGNTAETLNTSIFTAKAYDWNNDTPGEFCWRDVRVSWYKHLGRETRINRKLTEDELAMLAQQCASALLVLA